MRAMADQFLPCSRRPAGGGQMRVHYLPGPRGTARDQETNDDRHGPK